MARNILAWLRTVENMKHEAKEIHCCPKLTGSIVPVENGICCEGGKSFIIHFPRLRASCNTIRKHNKMFHRNVDENALESFTCCAELIKTQLALNGTVCSTLVHRTDKSLHDVLCYY